MKLDPSMRKTAIVFVILVLLAGYYYFIEVRHSKSVQTGKTMVNRLYPISADEITTIRIQNDKDTIVLEKQENDYPAKWLITAPVSSLANDNMADGIVFSLTDLVPERTITANATRDELNGYGLCKKSLHTSLTGADNKTLTGYFGEKTPIGNTVYFRSLDENKVYTIALAIKEDLDHSAEFFRDRTPLHFNADKVTSISIKQGKETLSIIRDAPNENWRFETEKPDEKADQDKIQTYLMDLASYSVDGFYDEVPESFTNALEVPVLEITVVENNIPRVLKLGNILEDNQITRFVGTNEIDYCLKINTDFINTFALKREDFVSRKMLDFDPWNVNMVKIHYNQTDYSFLRENDQWKVQTPEQSKNHSVEVTQWLWNLREMEYMDISFLKREKLTPTQILSVELLENETQLETISFLTVKKDNIELVMAKLDNDDKVFEVDGNVVEELEHILSAIPAGK